MERLLYRTMLALLLVTAAGFGIFASVAVSPGWLGPLRFDTTVFLAVLWGSIPATMLLFLPLRLATSGGRRVVWIRHPASTFEHVSGDESAVVAQTVRQRLGELGFTVQSAQDTSAGTAVLFGKAKAAKVVRFIDHAFAGELTTSRDSGRTRVSVTVIFQDIVLLESGESDRLAALARYLSGATDDLRVAVVPFTLVCGSTIATLNLALPFASLRPWLASHQLAVAFAAVGMILLGGSPILRNRGENHGLPLALLGLAAALLPLALR